MPKKDSNSGLALSHCPVGKAWTSAVTEHGRDSFCGGRWDLVEPWQCTVLGNPPVQ